MDNLPKGALVALNQRPIAYQPAYAHISGSAAGGVLLSQIAYWWYTMGGEFYKTDKDFSDDTCLGIYELRAAKKRLVEIGIISTQRKGVPAKTYYTVNEDILLEQITSWGNNHKLDCGKTANKKRKKPPTITETTQETTSETTNSCDAEAPQDAMGSHVNDVIKEFEPVNPSFERLYPNKTQRKALERLIEKWGVDSVIAIVRFLPQTNGKKYAPTITTPLQLEDKLGALKAYCDKLRDTSATNKPPKEIIGL